MNLFELTSEYQTALERIAVDEETGEVKGFEELEGLETVLQEKIENVALFIKSKSAFIDAMKDEKKKMEQRIKTEEKSLEWLKIWLAGSMEAIECDKFETPKAKITFRTSKKVEIMPEFIEWAEKHDDFFLNFKEPEVNKTKIKKAIQEGETFEFAKLVETKNIQIK